MRIMHVAEVAHGGVISLLQTFADVQVRAGHDVHVLLPPDVQAPAGQVHRWRPRRTRPWLLPRAVATLRSTIRQVGPDVLHLHSFVPGFLGRLTPVPAAVVYQPHSWAFQAVPGGMARRAVIGWEKTAARRTSMVVTNSTDEWREADQLGVKARARVVGLPIDTAHFRPVDAHRRASLRAELGLEGKTVLVCVGRLSAQKGQHHLVAAWERQPLPHTVLILVGPGDPSQLAVLAPRSFGQTVLHVGPQTDVRPWLWAADLVVQPSLYEGQSVAMAEALACGRPSVMTDVNGARDGIAPPGQPSAGAVVPVGDMDALLHECARRLGRDRSRLEAEGRAARARAVSLFDRDAVMSRVETAYQDAVAHRRAVATAAGEGRLS